MQLRIVGNRRLMLLKEKWLEKKVIKAFTNNEKAVALYKIWDIGRQVSRFTYHVPHSSHSQVYFYKPPHWHHQS